MSKERELLESCLDEMQYHSFVCPELILEIQERLAKPEGGSLSSKEIADFLDSKDEANFKISYDYEQGFEDGVKFAESHHGM